MYEAFYGLREKPFNLTPDPKFLYLSEKHKEAFAHLLYGIKNRSGFVMVTGEIGTGKTTICRTLLNQLDDATEVAFIFNPCLSPEELLRKINEDFGIKSTATSIKGLIDELNAYLLEKNAKGKNCVLVIDEAQNLRPNVLEQIRLLSNLETETQKLLQIVLIGQPELVHLLALDELRQLNQRITARYHLDALDRDETQQYVAYRLRVAGGRRRIHFAPAAMRLVYRYSKGTPRVINALCDRALLIGYTRELRDISAAVIRQAHREIRGEEPKPARFAWLRRLAPNPSLLVTALLVVFAVALLRDRIFGPIAYEPVGAAQASAATDEPRRNTGPMIEARSHNEALAVPAPDLPALADVKPEQAVAAPAPPVAPDAAKSLSELVDRLDGQRTRNAAAGAILRAWNLALVKGYPADDSLAGLARFAGENRLTFESLKLPLEQLETINLPAFVRLHGRRNSVWVALVGIADGDPRITTESEDSSIIPREQFLECYLNEAVILWRDPNPTATLLRPGMTGDDVRVLQVQLRALGRLKRKPTGEYDDATAQSIQALQSETGLTVDGLLGRQTRMVLYSWLPGYATPGLRALPPLLMEEAEVAATENAAPPAGSAVKIDKSVQTARTVPATGPKPAEAMPKAPTKPADTPPAAPKTDVPVGEGAAEQANVAAAPSPVPDGAPSAAGNSTAEGRPAPPSQASQANVGEAAAAPAVVSEELPPVAPSAAETSPPDSPAESGTPPAAEQQPAEETAQAASSPPEPAPAAPQETPKAESAPAAPSWTASLPLVPREPEEDDSE